MDHASGANPLRSVGCLSMQEFDEQGRIDSYPWFHYDVLEIGYLL
jgi:hypothetical protein